MDKAPRTVRDRFRLPVLAAALALAALVAALVLVRPAPVDAAEQAVENFDGLRSQLKPSQDENIPDDVLGWTHTPPEGWSVEVSPQMPQGGMTEWRGWSFTTREFWTAADQQERENFTRARDVFAVADPDEWDDKGSPTRLGRFDSTLKSKPIPLPSQNRVYLGFASHYRQEAPQKAEVLVSFDGGQDRQVLRYGPETTADNRGQDRRNEFVSLGIDVPQGAQNMTVKWRLFDASNNWYWAIDDVRLSDAPIDGGPPPPPPPPPPIEVPDGPDGVSKDKVLFIGVDGLNWDAVEAANAPNLKGLREQGELSHSLLYSNPMAPTVSGPGWASIATGVWPDKHKVRDNGFGGNDLKSYPDFLTRMERANPDLSTFSSSDWQPIARTVLQTVDVKLEAYGNYAVQDQRLADASAKYLREQNPDAAFTYLGDVDIAGHESALPSARYTGAVEATDRQIGQLLDAVRARPTYAEEDWLIMVSTDHGHGKGPSGDHGDSGAEARGTFVLTVGEDVPANSTSYDTEIVDVAPTALGHLGITADPAWNLDGRPIGSLSRDPFDTLRPDLRPAVDEIGVNIPPVPVGSLGWTDEAPDGWSVDDSRMPPGGVTEWQGWSFAAKTFWSRAERDQHRENFVRGRNVVAVADPDEWDDKGSPSASGPFDSELVSPEYKVDPAGKAIVRFLSHYRQGGAQKAEVVVSFDDGSKETVLRYGADPADANKGGDLTSKPESVEVPVPPDATSMKVSWRLYDARNDWYWAVDDPQVEVVPAPEPTSVRVDDLDGSMERRGRGAWKAVVTVKVTDQVGRRIEGARVEGDWSQGANGRATCVTDARGLCQVIRVAGRSDAASFTVDAIKHERLPYDPALNRDPDGDSDGAVITVRSPLG